MAVGQQTRVREAKGVRPASLSMREKLTCRPAYAHTAWLIWPIVGLGLLLRLIHFVRDPSVWHDESALVMNVLRKDFTALLGPLFYAEAAPPLFLWIERTAFLLFGD